MTVRRLIWTIIFVGLVGGAIWFWIWSNQIMYAEQSSLDQVQQNPLIAIRETDRSVIMSSQDYDAKTGLVFLPGAKVDPKAYLYKLSGIDGHRFGLAG